MKFLTSGKVKDLYEVDDDTILFRFSDRVSAYDVKFKQDIPRKGEVLCRFGEFWFNELDVSSHFIERRSSTELVVKKMQMLPIECVVRGYFYGSLVSRYEGGTLPESMPKITDTRLASKLAEPVFDPTTKSEHDTPVDRTLAIEMGLVTASQYDWLEKTSVDIYKTMAQVADDAGFILADLKLEFGVMDGKIVLGDSIGPDEYRLWLKDSYEVGRIQDAYDKQLLRDWLTTHGYQRQFEEQRKAKQEPVPPEIPQEVILQLTARYVMAYEKFSGQSLD